MVQASRGSERSTVAPEELKRGMQIMNRFSRFSAVAIISAVALVAGCSSENKSPDVTANIRSGLDQAGLKDVSVSQDRDKGVVTLGGTVASEADKGQAESIAKASAGPQVVADQISVRPPGEESLAKDVQSDLDKGIEKNLDAVLLQNRLNHDVKYDVKNGVVTLSGTVNSGAKRAMAENVANTVPKVKQVVNEIEVKGRKATSSSGN
jgi:hyperosmotically inducible periplasmic protein